MPSPHNSNLENKILKKSHKYIVSTICIILSFSIIGSAEVEINTTLEDNLVILLDYSGSATDFRPYIQSNAIYSVHNIQDEVNVSVVVYGSNIYSIDYQDNRTILEEFIYNVSKEEGYASRDNITGGFDEARKILNKSADTKQIIMFSDGNLGKSSGKLDNDELIKVANELKKDNVTINLYQVSTTKLSPPLKTTSVREPYKDFGDKLDIEVVVINPDERLRFIKPKLMPTSILRSFESSQKSQIEVDEYLNEFSNNDETSSIIFSMNYDQSEALSNPTRINFYSYCDQNQNCSIIPFDVQQRKFLEKQIADIFRSKNAIELVKSGNITESAYIYSNDLSDSICGYYNPDVFNEESTNFAGEVLPLVKRETAKPIKRMKFVGFISKPNYLSFGISGACIISDNDDLPLEIINGGRYTYILKNGYAYNGIVKDFHIYNWELKENITDRKDSLLWTTIYLFNNPIIYHAEPLVQSNYVKLAQLSNQDYGYEVESAVGRFNDKSEVTRSFIDNATSEFDELNAQIPYETIETIFNYIKEPETNYSKARLMLTKADDYLNKAKENQTASKFNSANQNSNYSMIQSREGMVFASMENSKQRHFKGWVWLFVGAAIFLTLIVIIKLSRPKKSI